MLRSASSKAPEINPDSLKTTGTKKRQTVKWKAVLFVRREKMKSSAAATALDILSGICSYSDARGGRGGRTNAQAEKELA